MDGILEWVTLESSWIAPVVFVSSVIASLQLRGGERDHRRMAVAMSMYVGVLIGMLASGHLIAVTLKLTAGTLGGRLPVLYGIGVMLLLPSVFVVRHALRLRADSVELGRPTVLANLALAGALLVTGPLNFPLAIPAFLNAAHANATGPRVQRGIVIVQSVIASLLFVGAVRFFIAGGTFEDFSGMQ